MPRPRYYRNSTGAHTESHGVSAERYHEDRGRQADSTLTHVSMLQDDLAGEWLRANDPRLTGEGIAEELATALEAEGLTVAEARGAFRKSGGRPSGALLALRRGVAHALRQMYDDDRRRDPMAEALGCDRTTLWRLMEKAAN